MVTQLKLVVNIGNNHKHFSWETLRDEWQDLFRGEFSEPIYHEFDCSICWTGETHQQLLIRAEDGELDQAIHAAGGVKLLEISEGSECLYHSVQEIDLSPKSSIRDASIAELKEFASQVDILLMTVTEVERQAVLSVMEPFPGQDAILEGCITHITYRFGRFGRYCAAQVESTMGSQGRHGSTLITMHAITELQPKALLLLGIAFGVNRARQRLGDVIVAETVSPYELQRVGRQAQTVLHRGVPMQCGTILFERFQTRRANWQLQRERDFVQVHPGLLLSGEKLIDDREFRDRLIEAFPNAVGGEMEGAGAYAAAGFHAVEKILIKGICDWADGHKNNRAQPFAAYAAVSLAEHVLNKTDVLTALGARDLALQANSVVEAVRDSRQLPVEELVPQQVSPLIIDLDDFKDKIQVASQGLLGWATALGNNQQIPRPELEELKNRILGRETSTILVLGAPGTGKSALLAMLGNVILAEQIALLAIKADQLPCSINTLEDLQRFIRVDISISLIDTVKALAKQEKIVVLMDQLDAISELLDRKSERLNVLLNLIQSLSNIENVYIVATCREFEFRHDVRLTCINAERLDLQLLDWNDIAPILTVADHNPDGMGMPLRELLRTPLHLKLFLDIAIPNDVFESLYALLERLWQQQVVNPEGSAQRRELLELMANQMTELEELWLLASVADQYPLELQALEQAQILVRGQNGLTLGFCHQTYFDFTLARKFTDTPGALTEFVLARQSRLFVRPALLSSLNYSRNTTPSQYHQELRQLLEAELRLHIRTLILEFIAGQKAPSDAETNLLLPLITSDIDGPRILTAAAGSPGWFARLHCHSSLEHWLQKSPQQAAYCTPLLIAATSFAENAVVELLEDYWLPDTGYDSLSFQILSNVQSWNISRVELLVRLVRRFSVVRWNLSILLEQIANNQPTLVPQVVRAHLDLQLEQVTEAANQAEAELSLDATAEQRQIHELSQGNRTLSKNLLESNQDLENLSIFAQATPKAFLDHLWVWFLQVAERVAYDGNPDVVIYRVTSIKLRELDEGSSGYDHSTITEALAVAIVELAKHRRRAFWNFVNENLASNLDIVHRLLAYGLQQVAEQEPDQVLSYLLADQRRMNLGDYQEQHGNTKRLISAIYPHLTLAQKEQLENAVISFNRYTRIPQTFPAGKRRQWMKWHRQDRLRLLRAFPEDGISLRVKRLRDVEERAFPHTEDRRGRTWGGLIGARLTADEMALASDQDLLNLFDSLPDGSEWTRSRGNHDLEPARAGGEREQAGEFSEFAQAYPDRVSQLIEQLQPFRHEGYAGEGLRGLAESAFPTTRLIDLISRLNQRGFTNHYFREGAAYALEKIARRDRWLPSPCLRMLEEWLDNHLEPVPTSEVEANGDSHESHEKPILFGERAWFMPNGRRAIIAAIAAGYLQQQQPDIDNWIRIIQHRLDLEQHAGIWAETVIEMSVLFQGDAIRATQVYSSIFQAHPELLRNQIILNSISTVIGYFQPKEKLQEWLDQLWSDDSRFCCQAYGEMLFLYHWCYGDTWSKERIEQLLTEQTDEDILLGLTFGASRFWQNPDCRAVSTRILCTLASHASKAIQIAVAEVFRWNWKNFQLNNKMRQIIQAACENPPVLLEASGYLIENLETMIGQEAPLVAQVCQTLLQACGSQIDAPTRRLYPLAESLTSISLTLHRQDDFSEAGLQIFEHLLSLNLREARVALEILDRKPNQPTYLIPRRRFRVTRNS